MAAAKTRPTKKYYTAAEANATLPLIRAIVRDITELARELQDRHQRLTQILPSDRITIGAAHQEELEHARAEFERDRQRMYEYQKELETLGVELKDPNTGLVDFLARMNGRDVYLCWRLGESEVAYWHELDAGFAGRQKLLADAGRN